MLKQNLIRLALGAALALLPTASFAATTAVQEFRGGSAVYMNYPNGKDELLVNNFVADETGIAWDIYQSATPQVVGSWVLDRSYTASDFPEEDATLAFDLYTTRATLFNGDWYFVSRSMGFNGTGDMRAVEVWRIQERGDKPERVFSSYNEEGYNYYYGMHTPLVTFGDYLVFIDSAGVMSATADGDTWVSSDPIAEVTEVGYRNDMVSSGTSVYMSVGGTVYESTDLDTWTALGDLCTDESVDSCEVTALQVRPYGGVFALAYSRVGETSDYAAWIYKQGEWTLSDSYLSTPVAVETFGKKTYVQHTRGNYYHNAVTRLFPNGSIKNVARKSAGSAMGLFTKHLGLVNERNSEFVTLVKY